MKKKLLFIGILILSVSCNSQQETTGTNGNTATSEVVIPEVFQSIKDTASNLQLIDLRTPEECQEGMIEGAVNINYFDADFKDQLNALDKNKTTLIYCRSGGRSGKAAKIMEELGFTVIYDLSGGYLNWSK